MMTNVFFLIIIMQSCEVHVWHAAEITMVLCTILEVSGNMKLFSSFMLPLTELQIFCSALILSPNVLLYLLYSLSKRNNVVTSSIIARITQLKNLVFIGRCWIGTRSNDNFTDITLQYLYTMSVHMTISSNIPVVVWFA